MNQEPIFLIGAHKSGTSLLRSLFDGHSQLFVIPIEAHFFQHLGYWIDYSMRRQFGDELTPEDLLENFTDWIHTSNSISDRYADSDTKGFWDVKKFETFLKARIKSKEFDLSTIGAVKKLIEAYVSAMYRSLYDRDLHDETRMVEKSVENAEFAIELKAAFSKAKFIHIVRNPYSNMVSTRKYRSRNGRGFPFLKKIVYSLYNSYYYLEKNKWLIGDDYFVVKYEDLIQHPEATIKKLVDFTGIRDEEILYKPTVQGELWTGNSTTDKQFKGISSASLNRWKDEISPIEINAINKWFRPILKRLGYSQLQNRSVLAPAKGEKLHTYVQNRLLLRYYM